MGAWHLGYNAIAVVIVIAPMEIPADLEAYRSPFLQHVAVCRVFVFEGKQTFIIEGHAAAIELDGFWRNMIMNRFNLKGDVLALLLAWPSFLVVAGCDPWPPGHRDAATYFMENKQAFEALRDAFVESDYIAISHGHMRATVLVRTVGGARERALDDGVGQTYRALLDDIEAISIYGDKANNSGIVIVATGYTTGAEPRYARYVIFSDTEPKVPRCDEMNEPAEEGACVIHLADKWWLQYMWGNLE